MPHFVFIISLVALMLTGCGTSEVGAYIDILGVVVDQDGKPVEDATVVVFLDDTEVARFQTRPIYDPSIYCDSPAPESRYVGYRCYNFLQQIPRFADFDLDDNGADRDVVANARLLQKNEQVTFRSSDGRFLVITAIDGQPPRNLLLLQADNTIATPQPNEVIPTPRFSSTMVAAIQLTPTTSQSASGETDKSQPDFASEWLRPFAVSFFVSLVIAVSTYLFIERRYRQNPQPANNPTSSRTKTTPKKTENTAVNAFTVALIVQALGTVLGTIMLKVLGLA